MRAAILYACAYTENSISQNRYYFIEDSEQFLLRFARFLTFICI